MVKTLATFQMIKSRLWLVAPVMASRGPECPVNPLGPGDHLRSSSIFSISTKYPLINPFLSVPPGTVGYSSPVLVKTLTKSYTKELKKWAGGFKFKNKTGYFCILEIKWRVHQGRPKTNDKAISILYSPTHSHSNPIYKDLVRSSLSYHEYWREQVTSPRNKYAC